MLHGTCTAPFTGVRAALAANLASGEELGASLVVAVDDELVVDLWGGWADVACTREWRHDTVVNLWSSTKPVTSLAVLLLVDRGLVDLRAPVARYWPEFAAAGKAEVEVRHLLAHTSGVAGWDRPVLLTDLYDREASTARLAAQAPWWEPGSASGYHAASQGHLLGELVRRVDGRTLTRFVADELARPLEADVTIGVGDTDPIRVAEVVPPPPVTLGARDLGRGSPALRALGGPPLDPPAANTAAWRRAELGALNGHASARGLARVMGTFTSGSTREGGRLLGHSTLDEAFWSHADGTDLVLGVPLRWGLGIALPSAGVPWVPGGRVGFWVGWGGSLALADRDRRVTIAYVMNRMGAGLLGSERTRQYLGEVYAAL